MSKGILQIMGMGRQLGSGAESTAEMMDGVHILALVAKNLGNFKQKCKGSKKECGALF